MISTLRKEIHGKVNVQIEMGLQESSPPSQPDILLVSSAQVATALPQVMLPPSFDEDFLYTQPVKPPPSNGPSETGYLTSLPKNDLGSV